ncbi:MAG: flagellar assembly protein T N-terminal domain-containing protein, partial [Candidatus Puniceispirillum sp.]
MSQRRLISALGILVGLVLLPQAGIASLRFTEATGRAVIQPGADPSEARMIALEDALYLAALQGGATVDGFSAINTDTSLTDQVVVRPASKIMDYAVINEVIDGDHFAVTIRAAVGDLTQTKCQRPNINLTLFKPVFDIDQKIPAWAATF